MYNFFVNNDQINEANAEITVVGDDYNHIKNVLRMKVGDKIYISNKENGKSYLTEISEICDSKASSNTVNVAGKEKGKANKNIYEKVICKILEERASTEPKIKVRLYQGIPKSDKMELIIQKSVELGVYDITPVEMEYCVAKLKDPAKKIQRWQTISEASAKQSKRMIIPKINMPINVNKMCEEFKDFDLVLVAYENEENTSLKEVLSQNPNAKNIAIIVGPEGGISEKEFNKYLEYGAKSASLGKRILRCETAPIAMMSMLMYNYDL